MNWLKYLVGFSALLVAGCAAFFSVTGLSVLFSGAAISVMIMAGSLEFAKLVAATYLKQTWETIGGFNKWYLTLAVGLLMLITSAGIFGYLSNAFQQQNIKLEQVAREISVYDTKIKQNDAEVARYSEQLKNLQQIRNSQESNISKIVDKNGSTSRLTQMVGSSDKELSKISQKINSLTDDNNTNYGKINEIKNTNINLEKEVGGFRFVADAFKMDLNTVVKFFIFLIVFVFDPLAIALIIAFNGLVARDRENRIDSIISNKDTPAEIKRYKVYGERPEQIISSEQDAEIFTESIINPPIPNDELQKAADKYSASLKEADTNTVSDNAVNVEEIVEKKKLRNPFQKLTNWIRS